MEKNLNAMNDVDNMEQAAKEFKEDKYKFEAFISYRHLEPDATIAQEIHKMIETFKVPKEFYIDGQRPTFRVFRDREELTAKDLSDSIEDALKNSKYLIVICSKRTPLSEWCVKEIETFRKLHGDDRIIPVLIEGEPYESFPKPLKELRRSGSEDGETQDVLAVDLRPEEVKKLSFVGYEELEKSDPQKNQSLKKDALKLLKTEKYRLMATILGCSYGDLKQRDKERRNRTRLMISSIVTVAMLIFGVFMTNAYQKAERARREAVQSNASILLKRSREIINDGDSIKAILVAQEAMKPIEPSMENYETLKLQAQGIYNDSIYHNGAAMLTTIPTKNKLTFFSINNDGNKLAFGYGNNQTAIYNPNNGELIKLLDGHSEQVKITGFSPDGTILASSSFDENTIIYDANSGEEVNRIVQTGIPMMTKFSKDSKRLSLASFTSEGLEVSVYNREGWEKTGTIMLTDPVTYAEVSDDGEEILVVVKKDRQSELSRRSLKTGEIIKVYAGPKFENKTDLDLPELSKEILWATYSKDGKSIIAEASGDIVKMNISDGEYVFHKENSADVKNSVPIENSDGSKIVFKGFGKTVSIIDGQTGEEIENIFFDTLNVVSFTYDEKSNTIVVSAENGVLGIWKDGAIIEKNLSYGHGVPTEMRFTPDGSKLITSAHENQIIKVIDIDSKLLKEPIPAQLVAVSNDSSKVLLYDGEGFSIWKGKDSKPERINIDTAGIIKYVSEIRDFKISNDGRFIARLMLVIDDNGQSKKVIQVDDIAENTTFDVVLESPDNAFTFTADSKGVLVIDGLKGLKVYDTKDGSIIKTHESVVTNSYRVLMSEDGKTFAINRLSGTGEIYNLDTGELLKKIPGEILYLSGEGEELKVRGIYNNSGFRLDDGKLELFDLDEYSAETPVSFVDINLYNEKSKKLLMIRNNDNKRVSYLMDFVSGKLLMSFNSSLSDYRVNGYISPDGDTIAMDQYYYTSYDLKDPSNTESYRATAIYEILGEDETLTEIEKIKGGRSLTEDEKVQIGIK